MTNYTFREDDALASAVAALEKNLGQSPSFPSQLLSTPNPPLNPAKSGECKLHSACVQNSTAKRNIFKFVSFIGLVLAIF